MRRTARLGKGIAMRLKSEKAQFDLRAQEIDRLSQWLEAKLSTLAVRREDRIRIRLLTEELLLRMRERFGEETPVDAYLESAFGRPVFRVEIAGEAFNPLRETGSSLGDWNDSLITAVKIAPRYTYSWGRNVLRFPCPEKPSATRCRSFPPSRWGWRSASSGPFSCRTGRAITWQGRCFPRCTAYGSGS